MKLIFEIILFSTIQSCIFLLFYNPSSFFRQKEGVRILFYGILIEKAPCLLRLFIANMMFGQCHFSSLTALKKVFFVSRGTIHTCSRFHFSMVCSQKTAQILCVFFRRSRIGSSHRFSMVCSQKTAHSITFVSQPIIFLLFSSFC